MDKEAVSRRWVFDRIGKAVQKGVSPERSARARGRLFQNWKKGVKKGRPPGRNELNMNAADALLAAEKKAMDKELATAVFKRWNDGLPVSEKMLYKAAEATGIDPEDALLEARFYTMLRHDLTKLASGEPIPTPGETWDLRVYTAAAGISPDRESTAGFCKLANKYSLSPISLALQKLAERNWVPDLPMLKEALMAPNMAMESGEAGAMGAPQAAMAGQEAAGGAQMPMGPQPGAVVQQPNLAQYRPSPMAPSQVPPSAEGNLLELVEAARHPEPGGDLGGGGMGPDQAGAMGPPSMMSEAGPEPPPQMSPEEKIQQVAPDVPPERMPEYANELAKLEQQVGMPVQDPQQVQKFVDQMKKQDAKKIDEAIKQIGTPDPLTPAAQRTPEAKAQQQAQGGAGASSAPSPATQTKVARLDPLKLFGRSGAHKRAIEKLRKAFLGAKGKAPSHIREREINFGYGMAHGAREGQREGLKKGLGVAAAGTGIGAGVGYAVGRKGKKKTAAPKIKQLLMNLS